MIIAIKHKDENSFINNDDNNVDAYNKHNDDNDNHNIDDGDSDNYS